MHSSRTSRRTSLSTSVLAVVLSAAVAGAAAGNPGGEAIIIGKVTAADTKEPLPYAAVAVYSLSSLSDTLGTPAGGTWSEADGSFRVVTKPGFYKLHASFISYKKWTLAREFPADTTVVDIELQPDRLEIEEVVVVGVHRKDNEAALVAQQRKSAAVSDGVGADQIARTTDSNAAEVLTRVTGMSITEGRYAEVRGLGGRYSNTQINGTTVGSPEPNRRIVPLDLFASGLLENLVVQKTYTPDQPGEFGGGLVQLSTRDFPGRKVWGISASLGYNAVTTGKDFYRYDGGAKDWLGFDDGTRDLPETVRRMAAGERVSYQGFSGDRGFTPEEIEQMGEAFNGEWEPKKTNALPARGFSGSYGNEIQLFGRSLGFFGTASYSNAYQYTEHEERTFAPGATEGELIPRTDYDVSTSEYSALWGAVSNASYRLADRTVLSLRAMYNRSAEDEVRRYSGYNEDLNTQLRNTRLMYVERGVFSGTAELEHRLKPLFDSKFTWRYTRSDAERNEPDRREYQYEAVERATGTWWLLTTRDPNFTRTFGETTDHERGVQGHWELPFFLRRDLDSRLKAGFLVMDKERGTDYRRFKYNVPTRGVDLTLPPDSLLQAENIGGASTSFRLEELTRPSDAYRGTHDLSAEYVMADLKLTGRLRMIGGVRWESSDQHVDTHSPFASLTEDESYEARLETSDALPSLNVVLGLREGVNLRAAYSRTLARPDLRELSPMYFQDFRSGYARTGNPDLGRTLIDSYDLRLEHFPGIVEVFAASAFYKRFQDPIEMTLIGGQQPLYMPMNGSGGWLYGSELEARFALGRLSAKLGNFGLNTNLTFAKSETKLDKLGVQTTTKRPLEGQPNHVGNVGLFYTSGGGRTSAALLYNVTGEKLSYVGAFGLPDIYEQPRHTLDFKVGLAGGRVKLAIENLLDTEARFEQDGFVTHRSKKGRSASISVSYGA